MSIVWIIIIGFLAGVVARLLSPGPNNPTGFLLTTILGIVGAFVATFLGQTIGWYRADQGAGLIGATVGAMFNGQRRTVQSAPHDERERRAMPETAEHHHGQEVDVGPRPRDTVAAERDIQVVP